MPSNATAGTSSSTLLGTVILVRHGDRLGFYQDPKTYKTEATSFTPLGAQQAYQLGQRIRTTYGDVRSPTYIQGLGLDPYVPAQVIVRSDEGGDPSLNYESTLALSQGLWLPSSKSISYLANGTAVKAPMNGYQYVPIQSVDPERDVSLNGWSSCTKFADATSDFYNSNEFKDKKEETADFFAKLGPYLDGQSANLENMYNVWDYMNVQSVHNMSYAALLPDGWLEQARDLANWHEHGVFSSSEMNSISHIAGRTILSNLITDIKRIATLTDPLRISINGISYQPFVSLLSMFGTTKKAPKLANIVNYAGALSFEVWGSAGQTDTTIRMRFKNGSADTDFARYPWLNTDGDVPLQQVLDQLQPAAIADTAAWCGACGNSVDRGCGALALAASRARGRVVNNVAAGAIGAGVALALAAAILALLSFFGLISFGRSRYARRRSQGSTFNKRNSGADDAYPLGNKGSLDNDSIRKVPV